MAARRWRRTACRVGEAGASPERARDHSSPVMKQETKIRATCLLLAAAALPFAPALAQDT
ncbi:MAG: hypothetical protein QOJ94_2675, partial [Sphingomonadales bacterium]|nr:hypothetical protein [Sphingomonadales bacterium]